MLASWAMTSTFGARTEKSPIETSQGKTGSMTTPRPSSTLRPSWRPSATCSCGSGTPRRRDAIALLMPVNDHRLAGWKRSGVAGPLKREASCGADVVWLSTVTSLVVTPRRPGLGDGHRSPTPYQDLDDAVSRPTPEMPRARPSARAAPETGSLQRRRAALLLGRAGGVAALAGQHAALAGARGDRDREAALLELAQVDDRGEALDPVDARLRHLEALAAQEDRRLDDRVLAVGDHVDDEPAAADAAASRVGRDEGGSGRARCGDGGAE